MFVTIFFKKKKTYRIAVMSSGKISCKVPSSRGLFLILLNSFFKKLIKKLSSRILYLGGIDVMGARLSKNDIWRLNCFARLQRWVGIRE